MGYSPILGRFLQRDPATSIDGLNDYQFVTGNPINSLDPSGLYKIDWGTGFSAAEIQRIKDSMERVRVRVDALLKEIDDDLKTECCQKSIDGLKELRKTIAAMQTDLDPTKGDTFHFKLKDRGKDKTDVVLWWENGRGTDVFFNSGAKTPFNSLKDNLLDQKLFHELTHEQGTDDGEAGDDFNNAHLVEDLMNSPLKNWPALRASRLNCK